MSFLLWGSKGAGDFLSTADHNLKPLTEKKEGINMPMEKKQHRGTIKWKKNNNFALSPITTEEQKVCII